MRATAAAVTSTLATIGLLLALAPKAQADECQEAFERWAKISAARIVPESTSVQGACVPSEDVRSSLLNGLTIAGGLCPEGSETRSILATNHRFISSLGLCASPADTVAGGWAAKAVPSDEKAWIAAPIAGPPPAAPRAAPPPRAAAAVPGRAAAPPAAEEAPPTPPCLEVSPAQNGGFALANRRCRGHTVLAVIETPGASGETICRGYAINYTLGIRAAASPQVNYECVAGQGACNKERLGDMFPECDW